MWRHEDFWRVLGGGIDFYTGEPLEEYDQSKQAKRPADGHLPAQPADARRRPGRAAHAPVRRAPDDPRAEVRRPAHLGDHRERGRPADLHDRRRDGPSAHRGVRAQGGHWHAVRRVQPVRGLQQRRDLQRLGQGALDGGLPEHRLHRLGRRLRDRLPGHGPAGQGPHQHGRPGGRARPAQRGHRRRQPRARPGHQRRRDRPSRPWRVGADRLLQGPGEVGEDVPRDRRRALLRARRLRPDRGRRQGHAARPRLQLHQHRRGEGLPRRGGDGDQGPPRRVRRPRGRRARREVRPVRHRGDPAARGRARSSSRSCAPSCAPRCPATSCRAR